MLTARKHTESTASAGADAETADGEAQAVSSSRRQRRTTDRNARMLRWVLLVLLLGGWELASGRIIDEFFISKPSEIISIWWGWLLDGTLWYNASSTFLSAGIGFVIGGTIAILVGYALGGSRLLAGIFEPFITSIYSMPKLALVPLFVLWLGIGRTLQVGIAALVVFFLMFYNTFYGIRDVDRSLIEAMRVMGGSRWDVARRVRLPSALVWVVAGLKLSVPQCLVAVVVAEILASNRGLGHLVALNSGQFNTGGTFAALLTLLIIGIAIDRIVGRITRRALVWKSDLQEGQ